MKELKIYFIIVKYVVSNILKYLFSTDFSNRHKSVTKSIFIANQLWNVGQYWN